MGGALFVNRKGFIVGESIDVAVNDDVLNGSCFVLLYCIVEGIRG